MYSSNRIHLSDVGGFTITAISLRHSQVIVKPETLLDKACLICTNAIIFYASIDYVSILRLSSEDRRIARVHTVLFDQELLLFLILTGGVYLTICAESISLQ
jgi:hypothetical protein